MRERHRFSLVALSALALLVAVACSKEHPRREQPALQVSLCDLYDNPAKYEGKRITVSATITQLLNGKYLYPGPPSPSAVCDSGFSFIRFEGGDFGNAGLKELESSTRDTQGRKEFDLEVTGIFDSKYAEEFDHFRYRIIPLAVRQQSAVRIGYPLGAA